MYFELEPCNNDLNLNHCNIDNTGKSYTTFNICFKYEMHFELVPCNNDLNFIH